MVIVDGEVMLACGSGAAALEDLVAEAGIDAPAALRDSPITDADWMVLGKSDRGREELIVGVGEWSADGPGTDGDYVLLDRVANGWRAGSWGTCNLAPVLASGVSWAEIALTPNGLDPAATSLTVEVTERECASGRDPEPYLRDRGQRGRDRVLDQRHTRG